MAPGLPRLTAGDLRRLPSPSLTPAGCGCAALCAPGWESVAQPPAEPLLRCLGSLRAPGDEEPGWEEWPHAGGYWAADAPIAPDHFPYNRCEVWACNRCGRGFLHYTEFGGYYVEHRLRAVDPSCVVESA